MSNKLIPSTKKNPCPVCSRTKDGDCRISKDGHFVLCHSEINGRQPKEELNGFIWLGTTDCHTWGKWIVKSEDWQKSLRPAGKEFRYPFCDREGKKVVEEVRVYRSDGSKKPWMEPKGVDTSKLVPYRYAEALDALKNGAEHCFIVEGPGKADKLWELGLTAVAFANGFQQSRDTQWFEGFEHRLVVVPDRDRPGVQKAGRIQKAYPMAAIFKPWTDSAWWESEWLPESGGLDIKDWVDQLHQQGVTNEQIKTLILSTIEPPCKPEKSTEAKPAEEEETPPRQLLDYQVIKARIGLDLRYNELTKNSELKGIPFEVADSKLTLAIDYQLKTRCPDETIARIVDRIAKEQHYSPVRDYLEEVSSRHSGESKILDTLANDYLGTADPLHKTMLKRTLIGAVARAYEPGCKLDTMTILAGKQGFGKSTFLRVLASPAWFDDSLDLDTIGDKDSRLQLHGVWLNELQEAEQLFSSKRSRGKLKAFLTTQVDRLRRPYGRSFEALERHFIVVGTTNHEKFLDDPTGNRRFWVVPVLQKIPLDKLAQDRDLIWATATLAYKNGEQWWATDKEYSLIAEQTRNYEAVDPWFDEVANYVEPLTQVTTAQIFSQVLEMELSRQNTPEQRRVGAIMTRLGWSQTPNPIAFQSKKQRVWQKGETSQ